MQQGYVDAFVDKMAFYGSAGVGKTCTMSVVAGEDPPDVRNSTPIATRPVTMIQMQESGGKWIKYKSKQRMWVCAHISKHILGKELIARHHH
jgi:replication-associated recombination protein RarA